MKRAQLALAIFRAARGHRHPTQGGEHWNMADRLRPFVEQQCREAWAAGYRAAQSDADTIPYSDRPERATWRPTPNPYGDTL